MKLLAKRIKQLFNYLKLKLSEKTYKDNLKYLYYNHNSDELVVVFSGFPSTNIRKYNYVKTLKGAKVDQLFLLDVWGYRGSYHLRENGKDYPEVMTIELINFIKSKKKYKKIVVIGSSKGGTCAIYFGLKIGCNEIISGACQYNLGTYLSDYPEIFKPMMGSDFNAKDIRNLNEIMPNILRENSRCQTLIHLIYSTEEVTFTKETVDLLKQIKSCNIPFKEKIFDFREHDMIGPVFISYLQDYFKLYTH